MSLLLLFSLVGMFFLSSFWETPERVPIPGSYSTSVSFSSWVRKQTFHVSKLSLNAISSGSLSYLPFLEGEKRDVLVLDTVM